MNLFATALHQIQLLPNYGTVALETADRERAIAKARAVNCQPRSTRLRVSAENRAKLLATVATHPGRRQARLVELSGLTLTATKFHLDALVTDGQIIKRGNPACYYPKERT